MKTAAMLAVVTACALNAPAQSKPAVYVQASATFGPALTAAIMKKHVPVTVVGDKAHAEYLLEAAPVLSKDETGAGKIARCVFLDCVGMNGFSSASAELVRASDGAIVWAYQVRKASSGPLAIQSLSEAIAKHLKKDYLRRHPG